MGNLDISTPAAAGIQARPGVFWCANTKAGESRGGWAFPPKVRTLLKSECAGMSVLHLFGGVADFGVRLDVDASVRPDVVGDAWLPPFGQESFDCVILDPPYWRIGQHESAALFAAATWIARRRVVWFHTIWVNANPGLRREKARLVRVGDYHYIRCLIFFEVHGQKQRPFEHFTGGPAIKYNRWLRQPACLPFE